VASVLSTRMDDFRDLYFRLVREQAERLLALAQAQLPPSSMESLAHLLEHDEFGLLIEQVGEDMRDADGDVPPEIVAILESLLEVMDIDAPWMEDLRARSI